MASSYIQLTLGLSESKYYPLFSLYCAETVFPLYRVTAMPETRHKRALENALLGIRGHIQNPSPRDERRVVYDDVCDILAKSDYSTQRNQNIIRTIREASLTVIDCDRRFAWEARYWAQRVLDRNLPFDEFELQMLMREFEL